MILRWARRLHGFYIASLEGEHLPESVQVVADLISSRQFDPVSIDIRPGTYSYCSRCLVELQVMFKVKVTKRTRQAGVRVGECGGDILFWISAVAHFLSLSSMGTQSSLFRGLVLCLWAYFWSKPQSTELHNTHGLLQCTIADSWLPYSTCLGWKCPPNWFI